MLNKEWGNYFSYSTHIKFIRNSFIHHTTPLCVTQNALQSKVILATLLVGCGALFTTISLIITTDTPLAAYGQEQYASPYTQLQNGADPTDILCNDNRILIQKHPKVACVFETTFEKLETRGWILLNYNPVSRPSSPMDTSSQPVSDNPTKPIDPTTPMSPPVISNPASPTNNLAKIPSDTAVSNNQFALDFYKQINTNNKNVFFSPLSIYTAFSILYEGARGNTAQELQQAFGFKADKQGRHNDVAHLMSYINQDDSAAVLELANALWLLGGFNPHDSFSTIGHDVYLSNITALGSNTTQNTAEINTWAAAKTRDKIKNVISEADLRNAVLVITNAIYFKGTWVTQFSPDDTRESDFWVTSTSSTTKDTMKLYKQTFDYANTGDLQVLKLPYDGDRLSMLIILPNEREGITSLEQSISTDLLNQWRSELRSTLIDVSLPKFTVRTQYNLIPPLQQLGIHDVFGAADLTGISQDKLTVSKATQDAFVDVNEEGTEAAAITTLMVATSLDYQPPPIPHFNADHPFLFMIQDDSSGTILFMGKIHNPPQE